MQCIQQRKHAGTRSQQQQTAIPDPSLPPSTPNIFSVQIPHDLSRNRWQRLERAPSTKGGVEVNDVLHKAQAAIVMSDGFQSIGAAQDDQVLDILRHVVQLALGVSLHKLLELESCALERDAEL